MTEFNIAITAIGALVLVLGVISTPLKRSWISMPMLALVLGVLLGPQATGCLQISTWGDPYLVMEQAARLTLAVGLMGAALRLPGGFVRSHWRSLAILLGFGMPSMWLASSLILYGVLDVPLLLALVVGAAICATDPVIASTIVTGSLAQTNVPSATRHALTGESGANDGLTYACVMLPLLLLSHGGDGQPWSQWFLRVVLWEVVAAAALGAALGAAAGFSLRTAERRGFIDRHSFLSFTLALTLVSLGGGKLLGTDGILVVFIAGLTLDAVVDTRDRHEEENIQEAVGQFFTLPIFTLLGLYLPWQQWWELGWRGAVLVVLLLLLRRPPLIMLLQPKVPVLRTRAEAAFLGWFGPIGVAAVFYAALAVRHTGNEQIWTLTSLLVCASVVAHGVTAAPLTRRLGAALRKA